MLRIRELREEKGWSQEKLGDLINEPQQKIQRHENDAYNPRLKTLQQYADVFGVSIDYLTGRSDLRYELSEEELALVNLYRKLPNNDTAVLLTEQIIDKNREAAQ